jgi:hypothetical protein
MATKTITRQTRASSRRALAAALIGVGLFAPQLAFAGEGGGAGRGAGSRNLLISAPAQKKAPAAPNAATAALSCTLVTTEAPRGGRLEVEGAGFGQAPLVRIAGRVTRMIERTETKIAVQIPPDSDGGAVTVHAGKLQAQCGTLTIIGKNG